LVYISYVHRMLSFYLLCCLHGFHGFLPFLYLLQSFCSFKKQQQGHALYAEMPASLVPTQASLLEVGKVYNIKCFRVARAKSLYKVTSAPVMIYFTLYTVIELCKKPPSTFPLYVYELASYSSIDPYGPKSKAFHGMSMIADAYFIFFVVITL
jgi:hypothetical protein